MTMSCSFELWSKLRPILQEDNRGALMFFIDQNPGSLWWQYPPELQKASKFQPKKIIQKAIEYKALVCILKFLL